MKTVILDSYTLTADAADWAPLLAHGPVDVYDRSAPDEALARVRGAAAIVTNKASVNDAVMAAAGDNLRLVAVSATGYDCVDVAAAKRRGVRVANVPEYSTDSVAQFVFALLLELCHHVGRHADAVRDGAWVRSPDFSFRLTPLIELAGKTMGVVGFGRIGRRVGALAHAFGMSVLAHSRSPIASPPATGPFRQVELDELLASSDVVTLHAPLTPQTAGLIDRARLGRMRPTAFLINTARGALVVEPDLAAALAEGRIAGAAVDVVNGEPMRPDNPLRTAPNCVVTPHNAWATAEARARLLRATIANVTEFLAGRPTNVVA